MLSIAILMLSPPPLPFAQAHSSQHDCPGSCHKAGGSQADVFQRLGSPLLDVLSRMALGLTRNRQDDEHLLHI